MSGPVIHTTHHEGVAVLALAWGKHEPRVTEALAADVRAACQQAGADDSVRVVVLAGEGPHFCLGSGLDVMNAPEATNAAALEALLDRWTVAEMLASVKKPVVAAIAGDALDQGLEMALACDIRVIGEDSRVGFPMVKSNALPWDGGTQRLPRIAGPATALDLLLTGRTVEAREAHRLGLTHQVCPRERVLETAMSMARQVAALAPIAAGYAKEAVMDGMDLSLSHGLRLEADLNFLLFTTRDRAEGLASFRERRQARYQER